MQTKEYQPKFEGKMDRFKKKAEELVSKMTLEEKVFQTLHSAPEIKRLEVRSYNWWNESLHGVARAGVATVFPQAIGIAATFDTNVMEQVGEVVATEGRAKFNFQSKFQDTDIYKGLTFWSPNINIFRDPRWGRGHETLGEDPYLTSILAQHLITSMQGNGEFMKVAACAKHFAVHSGPESERHYFDAKTDKRDLFETYLRAFHVCVTEGKVEAVMGAYNRTNGEPCCGSKFLLEDILRKEWGFDGHVTSDCWAIKDFHENHKITKNALESVTMAMNNGCDLNCGNIFVYLEQAVKEGLVKEERLDEAVIRLFTTRMKLGLFEKEIPFSDITFDQIDNAKNVALNKEVSEKSLVLLKNQKNTLPLKKDEIKTIGVIGPNANNRKALVGNYEGTASEYVTVLEGIKEYAKDFARVYYSEGCHLFKDKVGGLGQVNDRLSEVKAVCENSDVIIAVMGLDSGLEGEEGDEGNEFASGDKPDLNLPGIQLDILRTIHSFHKPTILVNLSGSAIALDWEEENLDAIIQGWYPGAQGGRAIANLIFGEYSPEGKLPVTFYSQKNHLPDFEDYSMKNRTYRYMKEQPLYPFGYGLSYTNINVIDSNLDATILNETSQITLKVTAKNEGKCFGRETIQIYFNCKEEETPNYSLCGVKKVDLQPGEETIVEFHFTAKDFGLFDEEANCKLFAGEYRLFIGTSQPDTRSRQLTQKEIKAETLTCKEDVILYHPSVYES